MEYGSLFNEKLIDLNVSDSSLEDLFDNVSKHLVQLGYVKDTYLDALRDRESEFPTGLETKYCNIAIPHTDASHIKHPFIYLVKLNEGLSFNNMGDVDSEIKVRIVMFLGVKNPSEQIPLLTKLMEKFEEAEISDTILNSTNEKELERKIKLIFQGV